MNEIPVEILENIYKNLNYIDLTRLCMVNSYTRDICKRLWKDRVIIDFGDVYIKYKSSIVSYQEQYKNLIIKPIKEAILSNDIDIIMYRGSYRNKLNLINNNLDFIKDLIDNKIVNPKDVAIKAAIIGNLDILLYSSGKYIDVENINIAVVNGNVNIMKYFGDMGFLPKLETLNYAAANGYIDVIKYGKEKGIFPNNRGAYLAAMCGRFNVVKYLGENGIFPDIDNLDVLNVYPEINRYLNDNMNN